MTDSYVALDVETTGLDFKRDKIIEIGMVKVRSGETIDRFESFVNPGRILEARISELTGIQDRQLEGAPDIGEILPDVMRFIVDDILIGHGILFDYAFVKRAAVNRRLTFEKEGIDTLRLAKAFLPDLKSRGLGFLCEYYGIEHNAHRAFSDAKAASDLYQKLAMLYYRGNEAAFEPVRLLYQAKRETPITIPQKEQLYKLLDRHKLKVDYQVEKLTRNEASRLIGRLLAEYGR